MSASVIERICSKIRFSIDYVFERLKKEIKEDDTTIYDIIFDTINIICEYTRRTYLLEEMEMLLYRMSKDYYAINFKEYNVENISDSNNESNITNNVKKIKRANEEIEFEETKNLTQINGITYSTGTLNPDEDILIKKYASILNKYRLLNWG